MQNAYVVTGHFIDERTVALDEKLPVAATQVRLVVEPVTAPPSSSMHEVLAHIWERQDKRGHRPPTAEQVQAYLQGERASWDA